MLTFKQIREALRDNKKIALKGKAKINDISIRGVKTLGINQEV